VLTTTNIIPIWQPQGYSTNQIAKRLGELRGVKGTHTGTLDPMAEGVVVILLDDERLKRQEFSSSTKGYEFEVIFGIKTDSFDGMGFIQENELNNTLNIEKAALENICNSFIGEYTQTVPIFSAQLYKGKKLFEWGHQKIDIPLPKKSGTIYKLDVLSLEKVSITSILNGILSKLENINGDFRQEEIIKQWQDCKNELSTIDTPPVFVAKFYAETSRGLYIRSLSQDICEKLGTISFVYSLVRIKNGNYTKADCLSLDSLFGEKYATILKP
jgi:tRNA pseudouridine55 synthase